MPRAQQLLRILWAARFDYAPDERLALHAHEHHQVICVLDGAGSLQVDDGEYALAPGVLLAAPGAQHGLHASRATRTLDVKFRLEDPQLERDCASLAGWWPGQDGRWQQCLQSIIDAGRQRGRWFRQHAEARLLTRLLDALAGGDATREKDSMPRASAVQPVGDALVDGLLQAFIAELDHSWDQARMARVAGFSYRHLSARCRATTGRTPAQLLEAVRIQRACELLRVSDFQVAAIAERCGFTSGQHLARRFRAHTGDSPDAWRQRERAGIGDDLIFTDDFVNRIRVAR